MKKWHVIVWISGTQVVKAGVFNSEDPLVQPIIYSSRTTLFSHTDPAIARVWYCENLPSLQLHFPYVTL